MKLTAMQIKSAKVPEGKSQVKLSDGGGLYLLINRSGKYWKLKYRYGGKEKSLSLGVYPTVSLKMARYGRDAAKEKLAQGVDPSLAKKKEEAKRREHSQEASFETITHEWFKEYRKDLSDSYAKKVMRNFELNIFPWLGSIPIKQIKAALVLETLKRIADRGAEETARRSKALCSQVFCHAILYHDLESDPTAAIKGFLKNKKKNHYPCITDAKKVGELMRAISGFEGTYTVQSALKLSPYVFLRPGELRQLEWSEIDLWERQIRIPAAKMKMGEVHIVPLSHQSLEILQDIHALTGEGKLVFPSIRTNLRPISNNTINVALRRLGYEKNTMTAHGFRGMASTLLHELGYNSDYIERQLAHKEGNAIKEAYNHARHLPERTKMMQAWADYLDKLRDCG